MGTIIVTTILCVPKKFPGNGQNTGIYKQFGQPGSPGVFPDQILTTEWTVSLKYLVAKSRSLVNEDDRELNLIPSITREKALYDKSTVIVLKWKLSNLKQTINQNLWGSCTQALRQLKEINTY